MQWAYVGKLRMFNVQSSMFQAPKALNLEPATLNFAVIRQEAGSSHKPGPYPFPLGEIALSSEPWANFTQRKM